MPLDAYPAGEMHQSCLPHQPSRFQIEPTVPAEVVANALEQRPERRWARCFFSLFFSPSSPFLLPRVLLAFELPSGARDGRRQRPRVASPAAIASAPKPISVGGDELVQCAQRSSHAAGSCFSSDRADHTIQASRPSGAPPVAANTAMPMRFHSSQVAGTSHPSSFAITDSALITSSIGARLSLAGCSLRRAPLARRSALQLAELPEHHRQAAPVTIGSPGRVPAGHRHVAHAGVKNFDPGQLVALA